MGSLQLTVTPFFFAVALSVGACSKPSDDSGGGAARSTREIQGSVKSASGSQIEMASWALAFVERDSGIAKVVDIDLGGNYSLDGVAINRPLTILLLDPQYRFQAGLSLPGETSGLVRQFFTSTSTILPALVHNGPTISFADTAGITVEDDVAADEDADGIPDGLESSTLGFRLAEEETGIDTDGDGLYNTKDIDIDGDGLINIVDHDDDSDDEIDIFDEDANGDEIADLLQTNSELYYNEFAEYFSVQVNQESGDGGVLTTTLSFASKISGSKDPLSVSVKGPSWLFEDSQSVTVDPSTGDTTDDTWDFALLDDGLSEDGSAGDKVYARKVKLGADLTPKTSQMVFLQLENADGTLVEFPFTFPKITTGAVTAAYAAATRVLTLSGTPFVGVSSYLWTAHVFDSAGIKVFSTEPILGETKTYTLPSAIFEDGETYTATIVATSLSRIPGVPSWMIRSQAVPLQ
ncbi:MAG: hypothetical protein AB7T49_17110 [Oligoflexales bacterium]